MIPSSLTHSLTNQPTNQQKHTDIAASFRTNAFKDYFDLSCETNVTSSSFDDVVEVVEVEDFDESLLDDDGHHAHPAEAAHVCRNEASFVYLYELGAVVGAMVGCLLFGPWLFDTYGRRKTMFVGGACLLVAAIVSSATMQYIEILYGMSILNGYVSTCTPTSSVIEIRHATRCARSSLWTPSVLVLCVSIFFFLILLFPFVSCSVFTFCSIPRRRIGIGMLNMSCPAYIVEIAPIHRRGQLVTVWHMGVTVGTYYIL